MKLSSASTRRPRASNASHRCEPMKPAPPETTALSFFALVAANASIGEAMPAHDGGGVDVAPVHDHRPAHGGLQAPRVEVAKLVPPLDHHHPGGARRQTARVLLAPDRRR